MTERIEKLTQLTLKGEMYASPVATEFDREDLLLSKREMESKRLCEFILNQNPVITPYSKMTGFFNCNGTVVGDAFRRIGHKEFERLAAEFFLKPIHNLSTFEWQHATANYQKLLDKGLSGIINEIEESLQLPRTKEETEFLHALKKVALTLIAWAHKCSEKASELSKTVVNKEYRANLLALSNALLNVPENKPSCFYEAILAIYLCFAADPDSVGTLDRYLTPFYEQDIKNGTLTREEAKEYLQELFLMLQAATAVESGNFTRGGESHFCVGGYLPNGEDGFNELSKLILESLIELPTWIPQVTVRWTMKMPRETFRFTMDCERKDVNKRIAFTSDEKRLKAYTEICNIPYEKAVGYTTVGCNEPTWPGMVVQGTSYLNFLRSTETIFHSRGEELVNTKTFEEFYEIFEKEMFSDVKKALDYDDKFTAVRMRDITYLSSLFFDGCIKKAKSALEAPGEYAIASLSYIGIANVIDSLIVVKQFVFDEKLFTMSRLVSALRANWNGYEDMRTVILKKGDFFGNDTERSNYVGQKLYQSLYRLLKGKKNICGFQCLVGDLTGYNAHFKWFGEKTKATPDGRRAGDLLKFGLGQSEGKDRNGLSALLNSIAKVDPNGIGCGSTVTNILIDEQLIKKDEYFEKTVDIFETYFRLGGVHFQLNYVSKEDLLKAKKTPDDYKHLRVRVSGFSDYFVNLEEGLQDDIIARTAHKR